MKGVLSNFTPCEANCKHRSEAMQMHADLEASSLALHDVL